MRLVLASVWTAFCHTLALRTDREPSLQVDGGGADGDDELRMHFWVDDDDDAMKAKSGHRLTHRGSMQLHGPRGKCLNFLHIPKTAGTSIELIGAKAGRSWGVTDTDMHCSKETLCGPKHVPQCCCCEMPDLMRTKCARWHVPPSMDAKLAAHYEECETFCVVRDPLTRYRSELSWHGAHCATDSFTAYEVHQAEFHPYMLGCHMIPQVEFVGRNGSRHCQHVLKLESLEQDFQTLMRKFGIKAELAVHMFDKACKAPLADDVRAAVKRYYAEDYAALGYRP
mmetsp:Transcript_92453/g.245558  ORF Transcript_92453/g.245558 Transcript_92453/m.245558 type:complete len:282 (-) Transcript_92453:8-853(-)